jgi:iron(III) transport system substrate-binding protein
MPSDRATTDKRPQLARITALLAALMLLLAACGDGDGADTTDGDDTDATDGTDTADQDLGTLTMYTHNDESEMQTLVPAAEEALGIEIQFIRMSSGEAMSRVMSEAPNVGADMMWGMTHSNALQLADEGLLHSYVSDEWSDVEQEFWDPDGQWYGWSYWFNIIGVNTDLIEDLGLDMPQSWEDLTDPQYAGEIVMPDPRESGTAYLIVAALMQMMGEDEAWEYLEALDENVAQYEGSGGGPADLVAQGEFAIAITWDQVVFDYIEEGFPMEAVIPEEGVGFDLDTAFIFEGADNIPAAEALIDWLGTVEGQEVALQERDLVTREELVDVEFDPNFIEYDAAEAAEMEEAVLDEWTSRFGG